MVSLVHDAATDWKVEPKKQDEMEVHERSFVSVKGADSYSTSGKHIVALAHCRSEVIEGCIISYSKSATQIVSRSQTRSVVSVKGSDSYSSPITQVVP